MDIKELENIMVTHGVVLRAIPNKTTGIYEKRHIDQFPDGKIMYLEDFKRAMLVIEKIPKNAGKFILECEKNTLSTVKFTGRKYFDSIEEAVNSLK